MIRNPRVLLLVIAGLVIALPATAAEWEQQTAEYEPQEHLLVRQTVTSAASAGSGFALSAMRLGDPDDRPERVWGIDFEGNETYSGMSIRRVIALESPSFFRKFRFWNRSGFDFDDTELRRDEIRIQRFYQRRGFPHARVTSRVDEGRRDWVRRITFLVEEGEPTTIRTIRYEFDADSTAIAYLEDQRDFQRARDQKVMQVGRRYQLIHHSDVEGRFLSVLRNVGFAHADAFVSANVDTTGRYADVLITLNPGPLTTYGEIHVDGNVTVPDQLIRRHAEIRTGEQYSSRKMRSSQQQIFGHPLIRFVTINTPPQPRDSVVDVTIRVREHALRSLRVQAGAGLEERVRLSVSWQHRNPFGNAHNISISTRMSFIEQRANLDYHIPYVFNPKSRINISPFGQRLDESGYLLHRAGINNSFIYQLSRETAGTISYEFTRNREQIDSPDIRRPREDEYYNISAIKLSGYHNQLEVERYQGWAIRPHAEFSGFFGTGSLRYNRYMLDIRRYFDIGSTTQLAVRNEGGLLTFATLDELPSNVRFYTGGTNSVRGWQRRQLGPKRAILDDNDEFVEYVPVGGKALYNFNVELRQELNRLLRNFGVAFFLDGGAVWGDVEDVDIDGLQFGLGGGLRYNSPLGPIRIDLARKLNPTDEDLNIYNGENYGRSFDRWGIHFSIGQAF
ncbi:BamA/TamA family outer membrane protein [Balneolales bacterium ANBcel1]|nr:BamA/TamA family outer membrane protein [Balneolales bacterium ANBcel1]